MKSNRITPVESTLTNYNDVILSPKITPQTKIKELTANQPMKPPISSKKEKIMKSTKSTQDLNFLTQGIPFKTVKNATNQKTIDPVNLQQSLE